MAGGAGFVRRGRAGAGPTQFSAGQSGMAAVGRCGTGPQRPAIAAAESGQTRPAVGLGGPGGHLAGFSPRAGGVGRPAFLPAQRRGLVRRGRRGLGQSVEHPHPRRLHADHATGRSAGQRPQGGPQRPQPVAEDGPGLVRRLAGNPLEQGADPGGLPESGGLPR